MNNPISQAVSHNIGRVQSALEQRINSVIDKAANEVADGTNTDPIAFKLAALTLWRGELAALSPYAARQFFRSMADMCDPAMTLKEFKAADRRRNDAIERLATAAVEKYQRDEQAAKEASDGSTQTEVRDVPEQAQ